MLTVFNYLASAYDVLIKPMEPVSTHHHQGAGYEMGNELLPLFGFGQRAVVTSFARTALRGEATVANVLTFAKG
jgi:hypothetical protein